MTDIIERLETFGDAHSWAVRGDAADEVRRLRSELAQVREILGDRENTITRLCTQLSVVMEEKQRQVNYWGDGCCRAEAQRDQLLAALKLVMVGGNHLASNLIGRLGGGFATQYPPDLDHESALRLLGASDEYEVWCCWAAIMTARAAIAAVEEKP